MSKQYEVEIKSLLGSKDSAEKLKKDLKARYPDVKLAGHGKQLNHYFNTPKDLSKLASLESRLPADKKAAFKDILEHGQKISIRTRDADGTVIFIVKASLGSDTSSNGVKRVEFECVMDMALDELDKLLIDSGCSYQAKWSREREEYASGDMHICIDRNAGYGYLAEFEKVVTDEKALDQVRVDLLNAMDELGVSELPQDRLERMFAHYNEHWPEYYGTDKTFVIQ